MKQVMVSLSDEQAARLEKLAGKLGVTVESLLVGTTVQMTFGLGDVEETKEVIGGNLVHAAAGTIERDHFFEEQNDGRSIEDVLRPCHKFIERDVRERLEYEGFDPNLVTKILARCQGEPKLAVALTRTQAEILTHAIGARLEGDFNSTARSLESLRELTEEAANRPPSDYAAHGALEMVPVLCQLLDHLGESEKPLSAWWSDYTDAEFHAAAERAREALSTREAVAS